MIRDRLNRCIVGRRLPLVERRVYKRREAPPVSLPTGVDALRENDENGAMLTRCLSILMGLFLAPFFAAAVGCSSQPHVVASPPPGPSLPLPDVTPQNAAIELRKAKPVANSLRAWHYRPAMVRPLAVLIDATLDDTHLTDRMLDMLVLVVASRNRCFY
jgi:hypothetical protein